MTSLSDFVTVNISLSGATAQAPSFNIPIVGAFLTATEQTNTGMVERTRTYGSLAAMISDGFTVNSAAYRALAPFFAQTPAPAKVMLGRLANAPDLQIDLTPIAASSKLYKVDLLGPAGLTASVSFTSGGAATVAQITAGLVAAINTAAVGIVATDLSTAVRCKAAAAGSHFAVAPNVVCFSVLTGKQTHADPGIAADLAAVLAENSSWYTLSLATAGSAEVQAAAAFCLTNSKLGGFSSQDGDMLTNTAGNVALVLKTAANNRCFIRYGNRAGFEHPACALLGKVLPKAPGAVVLKFQQPVGVSADPLTDTQITSLRACNASFGTTFGNVTFEADGKTSKGDFVDVTRDLDYAVADIQTAIANVMLANDKLPYTDDGIACVVSGLRSSLKAQELAGIWAPGWTINVPKAADATTANKAARILTPVNWAATLAGSIFSTVVNGTISY